MQSWLPFACLPFLAAACALDMRRRLIPDWASLGLGVTGLAVAASGGGPGAHLAAGAAALALGAFAAWRGLWGWGDAKLVGAAGAVVGPAGLFPLFLFTSISGGALAAVILLARPAALAWAHTPSNRWPRWVRAELIRLRRAPSAPYGLAISAGLVLALGTQFQG